MAPAIPRKRLQQRLKRRGPNVGTSISKSGTTNHPESTRRNPPDIFDRSLGSALRQLRQARGLNQSELGRRLGVSLQQIQKYESGANRMAASTVFRAAEILGVGVEALYAGLIGDGLKRARSSIKPASSFLIIPLAAGQPSKPIREAEMLEVAANYQAISAPSSRTAIRTLLKQLSAAPGRSAGR